MLLGEYLVGHDLVSREMLAWGLETQTLEKIAMLANLSPETNYSFFKDMNLLEGWGGSDQPEIGALNAILAAVRTWHDRARVRATLNRIGKHPLVLHAEADVASLVLAPDEEAVIEVIRAESPSLPQLFKRHVADEEVVSSLVYTLAVTRQFAFKGQKKGPMAPRAESLHPPSSRLSSATSLPAMPAVQLAEDRPSTTRIQAPSEPRYPASQRAMPAVQAPRPAAPAPVPAPAPRAAAPRSTSMEAARPVAPPPNAAPPVAAPRGAPQIRPRAGAPAIRPIAGPAGAQKTAPGAPPAPKGTMLGTGAQPPGPAATAPVGTAGGPPRAKPTMLGTGGAMNTGARPGQAPPRPSGATPAAPAARPGAPGSRMAMDAVRKPAAPAPRPAPTAPTAPPPAESEDIPVEDGGMEDAELALEAMTNFRLAEAAMQRNDTATALKLAQKAVDGDPIQLEYCALLAWIKSLRTSDPKAIEASIQTLGEIIAEDPNIERALLYRGKLYKRSNNTKDALADFDALLAINPHHREAQGEQRALKARK